MTASPSSAYTVSLPRFEGPLDLLLRLIERAELDITTIALAHVADQFLAHVRALDEPNPQALAEFVSLAARLLLIKSRALLPRPPEAQRGEAANPDADAEDLAARLREYRRYKQAAEVLQQWQAAGYRSFLRLAPPDLPAPAPPTRIDHTLADLIAAVQRRMQLALPLEAEPTTVHLPPRLTVRRVAQVIRERLERRPWFDFEDLLSLAITRQELIVTFWAVLELLRRGAIIADQPELFGPIGIGRGPAASVDLWELPETEPPAPEEEAPDAATAE